MRLRELLDNIPFGKAPLLLIAVVLLSGGWLLLHPVRKPDANLRLWTFENARATIYREQAPEFETSHPGAKVEIQQITHVALENRLRAAFWADLDVPDIVELEISRAGSFFRGEVDKVGYMDLTPYIKAHHLDQRMVASRFTPYQCRGRQFGLPLDIHPVVITYRRDLFEQYGINPDALRTWDDFIREGRRVTEEGKRYMIRLSDSNEATFEIILLQNNGGYFDADGNLTLDSEVTLQTLKMYIPMVAGPDRIGIDLGSDQVFTQAVENGYFLCILTPDWLAHFIKEVAPRTAGKMALMPMPAFTPGGRRTSTAGGSMIGITDRCHDPDLAWAFISSFWLDPNVLEQRFRETGIIPPFKETWNMAAFHEPDPYFSNQPVGDIFASVADEVPPQYANPYLPLAKTKLGDVVSACAAYYRSNGDAGFEEFAREKLDQAAQDVRRTMERNPFQ